LQKFSDWRIVCQGIWRRGKEEGEKETDRQKKFITERGKVQEMYRSKC